MRRFVSTILGAAALGSSVVVLAAPPAPAGLLTTYTVNIGTDPAPGACEAPPGDCSAREAMNAASVDALDSLITVDTTAFSGPITLTLGPPLVHTQNAPITIDGNGATIEQSAPNAMVIQNTGNGTLALEDLTITGGNGVAGLAGGVYGNGNVVLVNTVVAGNTTTTADSAGGVNSSGSVTLQSSTLSSNEGIKIGGVFALGQANLLASSTVVDNAATQPTAGDAVGGVYGVIGASVTRSAVLDNTGTSPGGGGTIGGIFAPGGSVTLDQSTVSNNTGQSSTSENYGGVFASGFTVTMTNSTVEGNDAIGPDTTTRVGGVSAAVVDLTYSTIVANAGATAANLAFANPSTFFGSVLGLPQGGGMNCFATGMTTSNGYDYEHGDDSCGFTNSGAGDQQNAADPSLGMLADNGGPTPTRLPNFGSPLVNAIPNASCGPIMDDQRTFPRPASAGTNCDIGAVEGSAAAPPVAPPVCPANAALFPVAPTDGAVAVLILGAAPFALLRLLRRRERPERLKGRAATSVLLVGVALLVLAACQPVKPPPGC